MIIEDVRNLLSANDEIAANNRRIFAAWGAYVVNLMSAPGAGKTAILERTLEALHGRYRLAVIEGDVRGSYDCDRLRAVADIPVVQINTEIAYGGECHLDAPMIAGAIEHVDLTGSDLVLIENVGNLVCPAEFDVGEGSKVMVASVTEGEDKPLKYPLMYSVSELLLLNKIDIAEAVAFDRDQFVRNCHSVNPGLQIIDISARTGAGIDAWIAWLERKIAS
jgi:hydrogenase nickel incorporation protein HypB